MKLRHGALPWVAIGSGDLYSCRPRETNGRGQPLERALARGHGGLGNPTSSHGNVQGRQHCMLSISHLALGSCWWPLAGGGEPEPAQTDLS